MRQRQRWCPQRGVGTSSTRGCTARALCLLWTANSRKLQCGVVYNAKTPARGMAPHVPVVPECQLQLVAGAYGPAVWEYQYGYDRAVETTPLRGNRRSNRAAAYNYSLLFLPPSCVSLPGPGYPFLCATAGARSVLALTCRPSARASVTVRQHVSDSFRTPLPDQRQHTILSESHTNTIIRQYHRRKPE